MNMKEAEKLSKKFQQIENTACMCQKVAKIIEDKIIDEKDTEPDEIYLGVLSERLSKMINSST